jgi:hypothetical protein
VTASKIPGKSRQRDSLRQTYFEWFKPTCTFKQRRPPTMEPSIRRYPSPMAVLVDPKNDIPVGERDIRLEDYLNDKIQTKVDLGNLASLIATVDLQKKLLDQQVNHSYFTQRLIAPIRKRIKCPLHSFRLPTSMALIPRISASFPSFIELNDC